MRDDVWNAHHWLLDQKASALTSSERLQQLLDEVSIREILSNYAYAHDSRDLGWSGSLFTDDAILYNEMQNCVGNAEVVEAFRNWNGACCSPSTASRIPSSGSSREAPRRG